MFTVGASVMTRSGKQARIIRQLNNDPPYQYLAVTRFGESIIIFQPNLSVGTEAEQWFSVATDWNGPDRRQDERRGRERRRDGNHRSEGLASDRRTTERRGEDRRGLRAQ